VQQSYEQALALLNSLSEPAEGLDTADLMDAKALLDELRS
jgi:hypothetical protein